MAAHMTDAQKVNLVRNALLVAGEEMGKDGDHWPVIKSTVQNIMHDWEALQTERNVFAELKIHYGNAVSQMEKNLELCPAELHSDAAKIVKRVRDAYEACFAEVDPASFAVAAEDMPIHIKRAEKIMRTLEDDNG